MKYDLAIVGGGPAGYTAAIEGIKYGKKIVLFEKAELGGTCLNEGCIPLKTFLHYSKVYKSAKDNNFEIGLPDLSVVQEKSVNNIAKLKKGLQYSLKNEDLDILFEEVTEIEKKEFFCIKCQDGIYEADNLIVATGSEQVYPNIPGMKAGIDCGKVVTSREFFEQKDMPLSVAIIGGGVIGLEIASFYLDVGTSVSIFDCESRLLKEVDEDIYDCFMSQFMARGACFYLVSKVLEVMTSADKATVIYEKDGVIDEIDIDLIVLSAGRKPVNKFNDVEGANVIGDAHGKCMLAHVAMEEARVAVQNLYSEKAEMKYGMVPHIVYTNPPIAWIGDKSIVENAVSKTVSMDYSSMYVIDSEGQKGKIKKYYSGDKVIASQIVGNGAEELITYALNNSTDIIYPHPSISEVSKYI